MAVLEIQWTAEMIIKMFMTTLDTHLSLNVIPLRDSLIRVARSDSLLALFTFFAPSLLLLFFKKNMSSIFVISNLHDLVLCV